MPLNGEAGEDTGDLIVTTDGRVVTRRSLTREYCFSTYYVT